MEQTTFVSDRTFSQDEFLAWAKRAPRNDPYRHELLGARIIMTPPPGWPHPAVDTNVARFLLDHAKEHGGHAFPCGMGYALPTGDVLQPDASFISAETWSAGPRPVYGELLRIVPDLVVEVLSASTRARDLGEKRQAYASSGVRETWLLDSDGQCVLVFRGNEGPETYGGTRSFRSDVLGIEVGVAQFFVLP